MSRPLRIEYPGAWYHVMNRGAGFRDIFRSSVHRQLYLDLLADLHRMFGVEIHGYCLMDNHYHLLLHTPQGGLQRAMRHLNGVYTQRYNRLEATDGSLFRGRYKAILLDADAYLLNVSRYIHQNPVAAGVVDHPGAYPWSSYCAFVGSKKPPKWLCIRATLGMLGERGARAQYRAFVEAGVDEETEAYYRAKKQRPIFGKEAFCEQVLGNVPEVQEIPDSRSRHPALKVEDIVTAVAKVLATDPADILRASCGQRRSNPAREAALYMSRKHAGLRLNEIAEQFGLTHYGSVSAVVSRYQVALRTDPTKAKVIHNIVKIIESQTPFRLVGTRHGQHTLQAHRRSKRRQAYQGPSEEERQLCGDSAVLNRYVAELKKRSPGRGVARLRRLLALRRTYPREAFLAAIEKALHYGLYDLHRLEHLILERVAGDFFQITPDDEAPGF